MSTYDEEAAASRRADRIKEHEIDLEKTRIERSNIVIRAALSLVQYACIGGALYFVMAEGGLKPIVSALWCGTRACL